MNKLHREYMPTILLVVNLMELEIARWLALDARVEMDASANFSIGVIGHDLGEAIHTPFCQSQENWLVDDVPKAGAICLTIEA